MSAQIINSPGCVLPSRVLPSRVLAAGLLAVLVVLGVASGRAQGESAATVSVEALIARAESAVDQAEKTDDPAARDALYDEAIAAYRGVLDSGIENAALHRNIGTVWALRGDTGRAVLSMRRAERLDPRDTRVSESLEAARAMVRSDVTPDARTKAGDAVFFWRGFVPRTWLLWTGALGWAALWVGLAARLLSRRQPKGLGLAAAGLIVFTLAFGSLLGERLASHANPAAVVIADGVTGYRGPSEGVYEPTFEEPIRAGVEGRVIEQREGWARLRLRSGAETWVRRSEIELV